MNKILYTTESGIPIYTATYANDDDIPPAPDNYRCVRIDVNSNDEELISKFWLNDKDELVERGYAPSQFHTWDISSSPQWILDSAKVEAYRHEVKLRVNAKREQLLREPVQFRSSYYDADDRAITNLQMWLGRELPDGFVWRDAANEPHIIDTDFIDNLLYAIAVRGTQLYQVSWAKKAEIDQLTVAELLSYDVDAGWQG